MKEYEIKFNDFQRMFIGDVPPHFYFEVIIRAAVIYLILMVSMRVMGKRMSTQLSRNEMAAVTALAAAIGVPLMNPDRGLLLAVVIAAVIIFYQITIAKLATKNTKFEALTQDRYAVLIKDGVLNTKNMLHTRLSRDRVFAQIRSEGLSHLGMVSRLYFEAAGSFSILKSSEPLPGLSVIPSWDTEFETLVHLPSVIIVCENCGNQHLLSPTNNDTRCENCNHTSWVPAVDAKE